MTAIHKHCFTVVDLYSSISILQEYSINDVMYDILKYVKAPAGELPFPNIQFEDEFDL